MTCRSSYSIRTILASLLLAATALPAAAKRPMAALADLDLVVDSCKRQGDDIVCRAKITNISDRDVRVGFVPTSAIGSAINKSYAIVSGEQCGFDGNRATFGGKGGTTGQTTVDLFIKVPMPIVVRFEGCGRTAKSVDIFQLMLNTDAGFEPLVRREIPID